MFNIQKIHQLIKIAIKSFREIIYHPTPPPPFPFFINIYLFQQI